MALRITQTDPAAVGERWEDFDSEVSFKLVGIDDEHYQIALERARRLIAREDAGQSLAMLTTTASDRREHDIQCDLLGRFIVKDWKGPILDENEQEIGYSPKDASKLLKANISLFVWVIGRATKVATDRNTEVAESVGKPLSASNGSGSGKARAKSKA